MSANRPTKTVGIRAQLVGILVEAGAVNRLGEYPAVGIKWRGRQSSSLVPVLILSRSFGDFFQSCETKSGTESLGTRLTVLVSCPPRAPPGEKRERVGSGDETSIVKGL